MTSTVTGIEANLEDPTVPAHKIIAQWWVLGWGFKAESHWRILCEDRKEHLALTQTVREDFLEEVTSDLKLS